MAATAVLPPHLSRFGLLGCCKGPVWSVVVLESVAAEVQIRGFVAQVLAKLVYHNDSAENLQVQAVFPVDEGAAVYHCEARLGGRTIVTHCMEKKKAEKIYDEAVKAGHQAVMAREHDDTSDILKLNLGNLPAESRAEITLKMVLELKVETDGGISFVLPSVLNPRYSPADHHTDGLFGHPHMPFGFNPWFSAIVHVPKPYSIEVKASVSGSHKIARIVSGTDPIVATLADDALSAKVSQDGGFKCDHDWSFSVYYNNPYKPHLLRETGDRSGTGIMKDDLLMLNFFPEVPENTYSCKNEIIFVVDRSGSMQGDKIGSAKNTLLLFLKSLPAGCLFNVVSFGSDFSLLFTEGSRMYKEDTLKMALNLQATMDADMGGTEILRPIQNIYSKPPTPGYSRQIILITDGEVWNVDQVLQLVARHAHETRLFAVGVGHGASTALVRGAARAGRGRSEMVAEESQLQQKVMGLVASMVQESVQEVSIACEVEPASRVTLVPKVPPIIFGGQHLTLYARVPATTQVKSVTVRGQLGSTPLLSTVEGRQVTTVHDEAKALHRLAARAQLQQWQLDEEEDVAEDMVALSTASGVVCRRTALIGIDKESGNPVTQSRAEEENCNQGLYGRNASLFGGGVPMHRQPASGSLFGASQPTFRNSSAPLPTHFAAAPATFGAAPQAFGAAQPAFIAAPLAGGAAPPPIHLACGSAAVSRGDVQLCAALPKKLMKSCRHSAKLSGVAVDFPVLGDLDARAELLQSSNSFFSKSCKPDAPLNSTPYSAEASGLLGVVSLQQFDGSWTLQDAEKLTDVPLDALSASNPAKSEAAWATALVLVLLERKFGEQKVQWTLLATKAQAFITACGEQVEDLLAKARSALPLPAK